MGAPDVTGSQTTYMTSLVVIMPLDIRFKCSQDSIVKLQSERASFIARPEGLPLPQLSVSLVFRASSELVVTPTTVLHTWQRWGLGKRWGLAINESSLYYDTTIIEFFTSISTDPNVKY